MTISLNSLEIYIITGTSFDAIKTTTKPFIEKLCQKLIFSHLLSTNDLNYNLAYLTLYPLPLTPFFFQTHLSILIYQMCTAAMKKTTTHTNHQCLSIMVPISNSLSFNTNKELLCAHFYFQFW